MDQKENRSGERKRNCGIPMDAESLWEWELSFILIAESIKALYNEKQGGKK